MDPELVHKRNLNKFQMNKLIQTTLTMFFSCSLIKLEFNNKG